MSAALVFAAGCSAGSDLTFSGGAGGGGSGGATTSSADGGSNGGVGGGFAVGGGPASSSGSGGDSFIAEVYGHSPNVFYKLDPLTNSMTEIGPFQGCSNVIDIAINKEHQIYGTTFGGLFAIDKNTAKCTKIADGSYPNSLPFVPEGTVDATSEALVGYQGATYVRISTTDGSVTTIGSIGSGLSSSGDIVSVIGGGTYLTVTGSGCGDCIIEVDPSNGALV